MSLESNFNMTFTLYKKTLTGTEPNHTYTWSIRTAGINGYRSNSSQQKVLDNGKVTIVSIDRLRVRPLILDTTDRILIGSNIYNIEHYEDFDGLGKEAVIYLNETPNGTFGNMVIPA